MAENLGNGNPHQTVSVVLCFSRDNQVQGDTRQTDRHHLLRHKLALQEQSCLNHFSCCHCWGNSGTCRRTQQLLVYTAVSHHKYLFLICALHLKYHPLHLSLNWDTSSLGMPVCAYTFHQSSFSQRKQLMYCILYPYIDFFLKVEEQHQQIHRKD